MASVTTHKCWQSPEVSPPQIQALRDPEIATIPPLPLYTSQQNLVPLTTHKLPLHQPCFHLHHMTVLLKQLHYETGLRKGLLE